MGIPSYVINWDELIGGLEDKIQVNINGDFNFDFSPIEEALNQYFPDILEILKAIAEQTKKTGEQRITGSSQQIYSAGEYTFTYRPESDILLTGLTYAQSRYGCDESYDLIVTSPDGVSIKLFDKAPVKDTLQQKLFARFFPVPEGYEVKVILHAMDGPKQGWVDFEYLNLAVPEETGAVIIRYMAQGSKDFIVLGEESRTMPYGLQAIGNIRNFPGYAQKKPTARNVHLSAEQPVRIIEFWYERTGDVGHDYDLKFTLRWENNSSCDLDLHAYLDHDKVRGVWFGHKEYQASETDRLWLDYDFTRHGANGYETQGEVVTVLGCKGNTLNVQAENYNSGNLREDAVLEISGMEGELLDSITIPKLFFNFGSMGKVWICDVDLTTGSITKKLSVLNNMGGY